MEILKDIIGNYWKNLVIAVLVILLFRNCKSEEKLQLVNEGYKKDVKISDLQARKYAERIKVLEDTKQAEKTKIITVIKEVEKKVATVESLTTKKIANYYQNRYKLPVTITQYGVALKDTIAKKNIVELVQKDGLIIELNHTKNILQITEVQSILKDSIIIEKDNQIETHISIEQNLTKSVKSEKAKKTFWQIVSGGILVVVVHSLIR